MKRALFFLLVLVSSPAFGSDATDLAGRVITAYGGSEAIERAGTFKQSGTLTSYRLGKSGSVTRAYSRPNQLRIDIRIPGAPPETRVLNGSRGWRDGREVPPMMVKAMVLQAARLDLPYLIMQAGAAIKGVGPIPPENGRALKGLDLSLAGDLRVIVIVDAETGFIVRSHGLITLAPTQTIEFTTVYSDHKDLGGMILGAEELHYAQGQATGKTVLDTSEVIDGLADEVFLP